MALTVALASGLLLTLLWDALNGAASASSAWVGWTAYAIALVAYVAVVMPSVRTWLSAGSGRMVWLAFILAGVATVSAAWLGMLTWRGGVESWAYLFGLVALGAVCRVLRPKDRFFGWMDAGYLLLAAVPILVHRVPMWSMPPLPVQPISVLGPGPIVPLLSISLALGALTVVRGLPEVGLNWSLNWGDFTTAVACYATFVLIFGLPLGLASGLASMQHPSAWSLHQAVGSFCSLFFFPAVLEEFFFRGVLLNLIAERLAGPYRHWVAAAISAAVFGALHYNAHKPHALAYVGLAFVAGLFYSVAYLRTGKLCVAALTHAMVVFTWIALFSA